MKAVLVIDMPKGCCECNCAIDLCHGTIPSQEWYNKRPSWCPLRPLPEKKETCSVIDYASGKAMIDEYENEFNLGFNACLDEILGDCITQEEADLCGVQFWHDD